MAVVDEEDEKESEISFYAEEPQEESSRKTGASTGIAMSSLQTEFSLEERKEQPQDRPRPPSNQRAEQMKRTNPSQGQAEVPELEFPQSIEAGYKQIDTKQIKTVQREETKAPDRDQQSEYKRQYIESTKRVLHHLQ